MKHKKQKANKRKKKKKFNKAKHFPSSLLSYNGIIRV